MSDALPLGWSQPPQPRVSIVTFRSVAGRRMRRQSVDAEQLDACSRVSSHASRTKGLNADAGSHPQEHSHNNVIAARPRRRRRRHSCTPYASPPGRYASGTRYAAGCGRFRSCHARHLRYAASGAAHSARPRAPAAASCGAKSVTVPRLIFWTLRPHCDVLLHACCRKTVKELLRGLLAALGGQGEAVWQRQLSIAGSHQTFDEHSLRMQ